MANQQKDISGFQRQKDGSALVNGKKYPKGTQEDDPKLPKMTPTSGAGAGLGSFLSKVKFGAKMMATKAKN